MKNSARLVLCCLGLACVLAFGAVPTFADDAAPTTPTEEVAPAPAVTPEATPDTADVGVTETQPVSTYGTCRVRCGFRDFYSYQTTYNGCCNTTQYCDDGSTGNAVGWNGMRCPPD